MGIGKIAGGVGIAALFAVVGAGAYVIRVQEERIDELESSVSSLTTEAAATDAEQAAQDPTEALTLLFRELGIGDQLAASRLIAIEDRLESFERDIDTGPFASSSGIGAQVAGLDTNVRDLESDLSGVCASLRLEGALTSC